MNGAARALRWCAIAAAFAGALSWNVARAQSAGPTSSASPGTASAACDSVSLTWSIVRQFQTESSGGISGCALNLAPNADEIAGDAYRSVASLSFSDAGLRLIFKLYQPQVVSQRAPIYNDNIWVSLYSGDKGTSKARIFAALADASLTCQTVSSKPAYALTHDQCSISGQHAWSAREPYWGATLTIPLSVLDTTIPSGLTTIYIERSIRRPSNIRDFDAATQTLKVTFARKSRLMPYTSGGPDIGMPSGVPPHRIVVNPYVPLADNTILTATFSDDAGKVLSIRNTAAKGLLDSGTANGYQCQSCGSFQSMNTQVFDSPITSASALGIDLSKLGVDELPFTFSAASYPIDYGYKLYTSGDAGDLGVATLSGTTANNGVAHDSVIHGFSSVPFSTGGLMYFGFFDAVANRTELVPVKKAVYPAITTDLLHSDNLQGSVGMTTPVGADRSSAAFSTGYILNALLRYGTQAMPNSGSFDAAVSLQKTPAVINLISTQPDKTIVTGAMGYRDVGVAYEPIDGSYDVHTGEKAPYASLDVKTPMAGDQSIEVSASGYRFADPVEARDVAVNEALTYNLSSASSVKASYQIAEIAVSQVGRVNNVVVSDSQGGRDLLPNGAYSGTFSTKPNSALELSAGYARTDSQSCNTKLVKTVPCYAYQQPSATGGAHWTPFSGFASLRSLFVEGQIASSASSLFPSNALQLPQTSNLASTSSAIVHSAAVGTRLFPNLSDGCSSLLLTYQSRGGDANDFAKSAPQPGNTETASLDVVPGSLTPALFVAYSRVENTAPSPSTTSLFVVRVQFGILPETYAAAIKAGCPV